MKPWEIQYNSQESTDKAPWEMDYGSKSWPKGLLEQGNIDLHNRPIVRNAPDAEHPQGSISTVRSKSWNIDGKEVLLPTVSDDGRLLSDEEAKDQYRKTGKHLGIFDNPEDATAYAQSLHSEQDKEYSPQAKEENVWKPAKGFTANLDNPMTLLKTQSLPAKFIQWMSTPSKDYLKKEDEDPKDTVRNLPVIRGLENQLNNLEDIQADRDLTPQEEQKFYKLQDLYGQMFQTALSNVKQDKPFDWNALWEGVKADPGGALAEFINTLVADPELMAVPQAVGLRLASKLGTAGKAVAAGVTGAGVSVIDSAVRDLADSGRIHKDDMALAASIGFVSNAALTAVGDKLVNLARAREVRGIPVDEASVSDILLKGKVKDADPRKLVDIINTTTGVEKISSGRPVAQAKKDVRAALRDDPEYTDFLQREADTAAWNREFEAKKNEEISSNIIPAKDLSLQEIINDTVGVSKKRTKKRIEADIEKSKSNFKAAIKDDPEMAAFYERHAKDISDIRELERSQAYAARQDNISLKKDEMNSDYLADKAILEDRKAEKAWAEHEQVGLFNQVEEILQGRKEASKTISEITDINPKAPTAMENAFSNAIERDRAAVTQMNYDTDVDMLMQYRRLSHDEAQRGNKERYNQMLARLTKENNEMGSIDPRLLSYLAAGSVVGTIGYDLSGGDWRAAAGAGVASVALPWMFSKGYTPIKSLREWAKTENATLLQSGTFFTRPSTSLMNYGESGRTLANLIDDMNNNIDLKMAERMDHVKDVYKNIPKENRHQVAKLLRHTIDEKEVLPEVITAAKLIRENLNKVLDDALETGVYSKDQVTKLKDVVSTKGYFPRVYDEVYLNSASGRSEWERVWTEQEWTKESLQNTLSSILGEKAAGDFIRRSIKFGKGEKAIRLTPAQAKQLLLAHGRDLKQARSSHLERGRKLSPESEKILEPFLMKDDPSVLMQYYHDVYRRIEAARLFDSMGSKGPIKDSVAEALMKRIQEDYGDVAAREARETYFLSVGDSKESKYLQDQLDYSDRLKRALNWQNNYETGTKLSLAALPNMLQALNNGSLRLLNKTENPITAYKIGLQAIARQFREEGRQAARLTGAANETTLLQYMGETSMGGKFSEGILKYTGFLTAEKLQRSLGANMGMAYAESLLKKKSLIDLGKITGKDAEKVLAQMEELRLPTDIPVDQIPQESMYKAGLRFSNEVNFRSTSDQLPLIRNSLYGKLFFKFKTFAFHQARFVKENVIKPAVLSITSGGKEGTMLPLLHYSSIGALGGMGVNELRSMIKRDDKDLTMTERYLRGLTMVGGLGIMQDALNSVWREDYGALKFLAGPAATDLSKIGHKLAQGIADGNIIPLRDEYINSLVFPLKEELKRKLKPSGMEKELGMSVEELDKELNMTQELRDLEKELNGLQ